MMPIRRDSSILRRLQYFEATARHQSIALAAEELGVSPSAVSHQLSELKRTIGEDLLKKSGRGVELTSAGHMLAQRLSMAFSILETSVSSAIGSKRPVVRIAACSSFGPFWLAPRLAEFRKARPDIDVELRLYGRDPELTHASADCIVTAQEVKLGYASVDLFKEKAIAVAAPGLVRGNALTGVTLITTDTHEARLGADWRAFTSTADEGLALPAEVDWLRCSHYILALESAKAGLGAALVPDFVAENAISEGRIVRLGTGSMNNDGRFYRACYKEAHEGNQEIQAVVTWLRRSARNGRPNSWAAQ